MLKTVLSIAGKPGLYRLVSQGKNMLIVESLATGKRIPAYMRDKVMSLGDISMYTMEADVPLAAIMQSAYEKTGGQPVDAKTLGDEGLRELFGEILPDYDRDRVYMTDIRKFFQWYNALLAAGFTTFVEETQEEATPEADADAAAEAASEATPEAEEKAE